jgi:hypothetical protein
MWPAIKMNTMGIHHRAANSPNPGILKLQVLVKPRSRGAMALAICD